MTSYSRVQVENEYGSWAGQTGYCDRAYLAWLANPTTSLAPDTLLFTTDGAAADLVKCGKADFISSEQSMTTFCLL